MTWPELRLYIQQGYVSFTTNDKHHSTLMTIPTSAITEVSYGQGVYRRVGTAVAVGVFSFGLGTLTALSKSKKHFVGLT